jgi:hypothetical protein
MKMRVTNGLAGGVANIDAYVVAGRHRVRLDVAPHCRHQSPDRSQFPLRESEEISLVSPWNNQAVSLVQRKGVEECNSNVVCDNEASAANAVTENAIQRAGPYRTHLREGEYREEWNGWHNRGAAR